VYYPSAGADIAERIQLAPPLIIHGLRYQRFKALRCTGDFPDLLLEMIRVRQKSIDNVMRFSAVVG
jgi:hypothetical protein